MWFDVEKRYKTIYEAATLGEAALWFDVEKRYKTIYQLISGKSQGLWFDVEKRYKTIDSSTEALDGRCGLM